VHSRERASASRLRVVGPSFVAIYRKDLYPMATELEDQLQSIARRFVASVFAAIRAASLAELTTAGGSAPGRRGAPAPVERRAAPATKRRARRAGRRSSDEVQALLGRVVDCVRGTSDGVSISQIAAKLGVATADLTRPLTLAVTAGALRKTGEKRMTRYFPKSGGAPAGGSARGKRGGGAAKKRRGKKG
jgi:hypothetical protein